MAYFLTMEQIGLRGVKETDTADIQAWMSDYEATFYMETGWRPVNIADAQAVTTAATAVDTVLFIIVRRSDGHSVGICGLHNIHWICRRAEFRIIIGEKEARGCGYGTEAARAIVNYGFDRLNLETIYLGVSTENAGAVRSYEKAGFVKEGVRRKLVYRNSRYYDIFMMSILREEWAGQGNA